MKLKVGENEKSKKKSKSEASCSVVSCRGDLQKGRLLQVEAVTEEINNNFVFFNEGESGRDG